MSILMSTLLKSRLKRLPGLRAAVRVLRGQPVHTAQERLLTRMPRNAVCAEIGVHLGSFSDEILRKTKPAKLHLIDPWTHETGEQYAEAWFGGAASEGQKTMDDRFHLVQKRFSGEITSGKVVLHRAYSDAAAKQFKDAYFDWIYIDGNHLYDFVKKDLKRYFPKLKPGGYLTGDDYDGTGWWGEGVRKAVDEFVASRPELELELIGGQFIIRKPDSPSEH